MPPRACRKDANHDEIANAFRRLGWQVFDTYQVAQYLPGWPDLVVCKRSTVVFVEVKAGKGELTPDERAFRYTLDAHYRVVRCVDDVLAVQAWWLGLGSDGAEAPRGCAWRAGAM
jgi:Holliday junction resolvase-like predicted endonuclease